MRRTSVLVTIAFLAGFALGLVARSAGMGMLQQRTHTADLAAIEKLHQDEIRFTLSQDPKGLMDFWAEDAVRFMPGSPPDVGKQAIQATNEKFHAQYPGLKVLSYASKFKDVQIEDGWACELGEHESQFKLSPEAPPTNWKGKEFHVLKRQSDGSWKVAAGLVSQ